MADSDDPVNTSWAPEFISFEETGDLWLMVGTGQQSATLLVDSHALCRTSKVFRSMLRSGFMESKPQDQDHWEVKLPEDKAQPFIIILGIIHNEFERTPVEIGLEDLYHLCILTNKYDMTKVLRPMVASWQKCLKDDSEGIEHCSKKLFVAWELGCRETVEETLLKIAIYCSINSDGDLVYEESLLLEKFEAFELLPLIDLVAEQRSRILGVYETRCKVIARCILTRIPLCTREDCYTGVLPRNIIGRFVGLLHKLHLAAVFLGASSAEEEEEEYRGSITQLSSKISSIEEQLFSRDMRRPLCSLCGSNPLCGLHGLERAFANRLPQRYLEILRKGAEQDGRSCGPDDVCTINVPRH